MVNWPVVGMVSAAIVVIICGIFIVRIPPKSYVFDGAAQFVSGTEYNVGEEGQIIVEVRDNQGNPAQTGCNITVWYPDKSLWFQSLAATEPSGNSYVNFTVPNVTGVYEYQANCSVPGKEVVVSKSFHVSSFQNETTYTLNRIRAVVPK